MAEQWDDPVSTKVLTFGEPLMAFVPGEQERLNRAHSFRPHVAGAELNTAIGLARLAVPVSFACAAGMDPFGSRLIRAARAEGIHTEFMEAKAEGSTGIFFKEQDGLTGDTKVFYYRSTTPMALGLWHSTLLRKQVRSGAWGWVHTTGITWMLGTQTARHSLDLLTDARRGGATVSFDVNVRLKLAPVNRWVSMVQDVISHADWLFMGNEEARLLFGREQATDVEQLARETGFSGVGVIVKRGEHGASASVLGKVTETPAWLVDHVVDSVGAGDGFNAGWIAAMVRGWPLPDALRLGALIGASAVVSTGDSDGYLTWDEASGMLSGQREALR